VFGGTVQEFRKRTWRYIEDDEDSRYGMYEMWGIGEGEEFVEGDLDCKSEEQRGESLVHFEFED
jgi:hypothetical protein